MGKRGIEPMSGMSGDDRNPKTAAIKSDIERTRADMSKTVNEIEERLSPAHLKEQVADLKGAVIGNYHDAKDHVKEDLSRELDQAKARLQWEAHQAKLAVQEEIRHAKRAVHEATVGRVQHMVHDAGHAVTDAGTSILDTIKENPVPSAMLAIGLGWLLMNSKSSSHSSRRHVQLRRGAEFGGHPYGEGFYEGDSPYGARRFRADDDGWYQRERGEMRTARHVDHGLEGVGHRIQEGVSRLGHGVQEGAQRVGEGAGHLVDQAKETMHDVGDTASSLAHRAGEGVQHMAHDAREAVGQFADDAYATGRRAYRGAEMQVHRAEEGIQTVLRDNPLAAGAVAMAIGAAVGLALPHTQKEDEWMGEAKDRLFERAEGMAHGAIQKVEEKAAEITGASTNGNGNGNGGGAKAKTSQPQRSLG